MKKKRQLLKEVFGTNNSMGYSHGKIKPGKTFVDAMQALDDMIDIGSNIVDVDNKQSGDSLEIMLSDLRIT